MLFRMISLFCFFPMLIACAMKTTPVTESPDIVYEVFVMSYCDSNGDGIGDIPGLISRLDYLHELGATAIWIMPIHPSPSYHKYDVSDYYAIDPAYGTMADMERLIAETHRRGMKLILDLVINHTSSDHLWFQQASSSPDNPYRQYYVWRDYEAVKDEIFKKSATFDSDNLTQWHEWPGNDERYYGFFWGGMPDLNFDHPPVREEVMKIAGYWLEKGVDGFRIDAAKHIFPDDRLADTRQYFENFTAALRQINPEVIIVGEVWAETSLIASLFKGLPSQFNFPLSNAIQQAVQRGDADAFRKTWAEIRSVYDTISVPVDDAIFLSNHDMNRVRSVLGGDIAKSKLAASILMTLPGTPYLYYGEEIGMLGQKPDPEIREPFLWGDGTFADTAWRQAVHSVQPYVNPLTAHQNDPNSIYHHYKNWIALRKAHPGISNGRITFTETDNPELLAYTISSDDGTYHIMHNLGEAEAHVSLDKNSAILSPIEPKRVGDHVMVAPFSSMVSRISK